MKRQMVGGWDLCVKYPCEIPPYLYDCFRQALDGIPGAEYKILLYLGAQVVEGTNYLLLCRQTLITNPPEESLVYVVINKPLSGPCTVVSITEI